MEKDQKRINSRKDRRKNFNKWVDMDFLHKQTGKTPIPMVGGETKLPKTMSNADRRKLGIQQDKDLEDYQEEIK